MIDRLTGRIALDMRDLGRVFLLTGLVSLVVTGLGGMFSGSWALRYGLMAALALLNWFALSKLLSGIVRQRLDELAIGVALKPLLLVLLLIYAKHVEIEISSFLLGLNTFFFCLAGYMVWQRRERGRRTPQEMLTPSGTSANG